MCKNKLLLAGLIVIFGAGSTCFAPDDKNSGTDLQNQSNTFNELNKKLIIGKKQASQERWFGFSTGFLFPFLYALGEGRRFDSLRLHIPNNASRIARLSGAVVATGSVLNAIGTSVCYDPKKDECSVADRIWKNEWSVLSPLARSLIGPMSCLLVGDNWWVPLLSSLTTSLFEGRDRERTRVSWSHQAGIVSGLLAGRVCNEGIKFVGHVIKQKMQGTPNIA